MKLLKISLFGLLLSCKTQQIRLEEINIPFVSESEKDSIKYEPKIIWSIETDNDYLLSKKNDRATYVNGGVRSFIYIDNSKFVIDCSTSGKITFSCDVSGGRFLGNCERQSFYISCEIQ